MKFVHMTQSNNETRSGLKFWAPMIAASLALFIVDVVDSAICILS